MKPLKTAIVAAVLAAFFISSTADARGGRGFGGRSFSHPSPRLMRAAPKIPKAPSAPAAKPDEKKVVPTPTPPRATAVKPAAPSSGRNDDDIGDGFVSGLIGGAVGGAAGAALGTAIMGGDDPQPEAEQTGESGSARQGEDLR